MRKKILYILLGTVLFLGSCDNPNVNNEYPVSFWNSRTGQYDDGVYEGEYKNHSYIFFKEGYRMGVVHNPDCKCHEKQNVE